MPRIKRAMAAAAAVASIAAIGAAPASAQSATVTVADNPCTTSLPACTDYVFDTVQGAIATGKARWNATWGIVDGGMCDAYEFVTGEPCPTKALMALGYL